MSSVAYKPSSQYSKRIDTKIEKTPFLIGLMIYGNLIQIDGSGTNSTKTLYTVPVGRFFFLNSAFLLEDNQSVGSSTTPSKLFVDDGTASREILRVVAIPTMTAQGLTISYPMPIRLASGNVLKVQSFAANVNARAGITGYEIDASLIPTFL